MERERESDGERERWQAENGYTVVSLNCMLPLPFTLFQMGAHYQKGGQIESQKIGQLYCADRLFCMCMGGG